VPAVVDWLRNRVVDTMTQERAGADPDKALAVWRTCRAARERLRFDQERGQLISRAEVVAYASRAVLTVRTRLNDMVRKMAARLHSAPTPEWIEEQLQAEVDHICATFARGMGTDEPLVAPDTMPTVTPPVKAQGEDTQEANDDPSGSVPASVLEPPPADEAGTTDRSARWTS